MKVPMSTETLIPVAERDTLSDVPTCELQWELERRQGVEAHRVGLDVMVEMFISGVRCLAAPGPMTVTVNRD